mgnify:CR=1 FL=1
MTILEIILFVALWICYGVYVSKHTNFDNWDSSDSFTNSMGTFVSIVFAPFIFIIRAIKGIFKDYK